MKKILIFCAVVVVIIGGGIYVYLYTSATSFVKLSHHNFGFRSPWGAEKSYKGRDNQLGQYVFADGVKVTVGLNKVGPKEEMLSDNSLSTEERNQFESFFKFIDSKLGSNYSGYEYINFIASVDQQTVDNAKSPADKEGYQKALVMKKVLLFLPKPDAQLFETNGLKGFVNSDVTYSISFWDQNGWMYFIVIPINQNITKEQIDIVVKSLKIS